jgi:hypothetical protein
MTEARMATRVTRPRGISQGRKPSVVWRLCIPGDKKPATRLGKRSATLLSGASQGKDMIWRKRRKDLSVALRAAFLAELAARFPHGRSPQGHRFEDDRWFAGDSPVSADPYVSFEDDNIMVDYGERDSHEHVVPAGDTPEALRAAARAAVDLVLDISSAAPTARPARPPSPADLLLAGARTGAWVGGGVWCLAMITEPGRGAGPGYYLLSLALMVALGALAGAFLLRPSR